MNTPVSFSIAKLLKEKGFDKICQNLWHFNSSDCIKMPNKNSENFGFSAPTIAEVVMWLYEKHGIWIYPLPTDDDMKLWQARIIKGEPFNKLSNTLKIISHGEISYRSMYSPTEAYEAAIEYCLNQKFL